MRTKIAQHLVFGQVEVFEADHAAQVAVVIGDDKVQMAQLFAQSYSGKSRKADC